MNTQFNQSGEIAENISPLNNESTRCRNWLRSLLLVSVFSVSSISYAAAIHDAAKSGDLEQVQRLVVQGADVNAKAPRAETPLIIASITGQGEIANYLLQRGANIGARNLSGLSSLHAAAYGGHTDIVKLLIAKGADVDDADNRFGVTPLHLASEENHIKAVQELLRHGADTTIVESNGYSALSRAGFREHWNVLKALLASGATCQGADAVGDWLHQECTSRANAN